MERNVGLSALVVQRFDVDAIAPIGRVGHLDCQLNLDGSGGLWGS